MECLTLVVKLGLGSRDPHTHLIHSSLLGHVAISFEVCVCGANWIQLLALQTHYMLVPNGRKIIMKLS